MNLCFSNDTRTKVPRTLFTVILKRLPDLLPRVRQTELDLLLTNDKTIQKLNKTYRKKDKPTDVLSFPFYDPKMLGQIVISVDRARVQAKEIGQPLVNELQFLFTHGLLHLLGYDHENPVEEQIMLQKTYALLKRPKPSKRTRL